MTSPNRKAELASLLARLAELLSEEPVAEKPEPKRPLPQRVLLTPEEAAQALGIGRTTVYALIKSGAIETVQIGRLRRIPTDALTTCVAQIARPTKSTAA